MVTRKKMSACNNDEVHVHYGEQALYDILVISDSCVKLMPKKWRQK